jgi:hypothetical protein
MDKKRERAIKAMIEKAGLQCERLEVTGGNHIAARLRNGACLVRKFIFAATPSDRRGDLNRVAMLRRFAREVPL